MIQRIDHYKLIAELKRGQTVTVYRAFDEKLERFVLLKVLQSTDPAIRERFTQEACILARLRHPNIVQVFNYGDTGTQSGKAGRFLAMEYIEGSSLAEILRRHQLPLDLVIYFGREILQALAAAHHHQIVHRDIKPQNILVDTEGRVKVTDFGLASVIGSEGRATGIIVGTPQYMSPEQAQGECATPASDLFSLGVVMYEMLSGFSPFDGETIPERMYRVVHERPVPLAQIVPSDSHKLITCVDHLLEKEPAKRPANAEQVIRELDQCETALRLNAQPADFCRFLEDPEHYALSRKSLPEPPARRKRVAGVMWASALAAIVVLLVAGGLWQILRSKTGQETLPPASVLVTDSADGNSPNPDATSHQENLSAATGALALPQQPESSDRTTKSEPVQKAEIDSPAMSRDQGNDAIQPQAAESEANRSSVPEKSDESVVPAIEYGAVSITCLPVAIALLDADTLGQVDIEPCVFSLPAGDHVLALHNPRFPPYSARVHLDGNDTLDLKFSLWETVAILKVFVQPWAEVLVDGKSYGKTPLDDLILSPGEHTVTLKHPERETLNITRRFVAGQRDTLSVELPRR